MFDLIRRNFGILTTRRFILSVRSVSPWRRIPASLLLVTLVGPMGLPLAAKAPLAAAASLVAAPAPVATISTASNITALAAGFANVPYQTGATYAWSVTGGTITSGASNYAVYFTAGSGSQVSLQCTVTNSDGVPIVGTALVAVVAAPVISGFVAGTSSINVGASTTLTPTFTNGTSSIDHGVGSGTSGQAITVAPTTTTTYTLTATNAAGTSVSSAVTVGVVQPDATITAPSPVPAGAASLGASVPSVVGPTYLWTISNGTITYGTTGSTMYYTAGAVSPITLNCRVTNSAGVSATGSATVNVVTAPVITSFNASSTNISKGQSVTLTPVFANGVGTVDNGVGGVTSGTAVTVAPAVTTTYSLYVTNAAGTQTNKTIMVNVLPSPNATITADTPVTAGGMSLAASVPNVTGSTCQWSITNGTITYGGTNFSMSYTAGSVGSTVLTCKVTNAAGVLTTGTTIVNVIAAPSITSFNASLTNISKGQSLTLTPVFTNGTAIVDNGVGIVTSGTAVTVAPSVTTTYTLTARNAAGTKTTKTVTVNVLPTPNAIITTASPVTTGATTRSASVPYDSVAGTTYLWSITNGTITYGATNYFMQYTAGAVGSTTLTCKVTNTAGGTTTGTTTVNVVGAPSITSFTASPASIARGQSVTLTPVFANGVGTLDNGVGGVTSGIGVTLSPVVTTTYTLSVTNPAGITVTTPLTVTVTQPAGSATITTASPVTTGATGRTASVPTATGSSTYLWTITNGTLTAGATTATATYSAGAVGSTLLTCVVTNAGVPTTGTSTVNVIAAPSITSFTASALNISKGQSLTLTPVFANGTGTVNNGVGGVTSGAAITVSPAVNTTYTLTVTNAAGTQTSTTVTVIILPAPDATITTAPSVTTGAASILASAPYGFTYLWTITNGTITYGATNYFMGYTAGAVGPTTLTCKVTNTAGGSTTGTTTVNVVAAPTITSFAASSTNIFKGQSVTLTPVFANGTATVENNVGGVISGAAVTVTPAITTFYILYVTNAAGLQALKSVVVNVLPAPDATISVASQVTTGRANAATVPNVSGSTYQWSVTNGTVYYGATSSTLGYIAGSVGPTTLSCTVTNTAGVSATGTATVNVIAAPIITTFTAFPANFTRGQSLTLTPIFTNGVGLVGNGLGPVISGSFFTVTPVDTTTYSLTVTNAAGSSTSQLVTPTLIPTTVAINPSQSYLPFPFNQMFLATSNNPLTGFAWSVQETGGGTINPLGVYLSPNFAGTYHVTATATADPTKTATATITVPFEVDVDPDWIQAKPGSVITFLASVTGSPNGAVTWNITEGSTGGVVTDLGVYTAPATPGVYHVVATAKADPTKQGQAMVEISPTAPPAITVNPGSVKLGKNGTAAFSALSNGTTNTAVTWTCTGGSIDASGHYSAPNAFGTYSVTATSVADSTVMDSATVVVSALAGTDKAFTYDLDGNLTDDGDRSFEWDAENRLVAVVMKATGHRSEFTYDGLGRRVEIVEKDKDAQGNLVLNSDKKYLWEGVNVAEERSSDGGTVTKRFYGQGFVDNDGTALFYSRDHLGSIRELTDASQAVRARYDYDPYGRMTKVSGDRDSSFTYAGYFWHTQSGLNLTVFRAYDPNLGRWISRDPIQNELFSPILILKNLLLPNGFAGKDSNNAYLYCASDPVNKVDVLGLECTFLGTAHNISGYQHGRRELEITDNIGILNVLQWGGLIGIYKFFMVNDWDDYFVQRIDLFYCDCIGLILIRDKLEHYHHDNTWFRKELITLGPTGPIG